MNQEIAEKLKMLRKKNGLSQEELAEKLGVSRQAVSKWERAEASPDTENLIMLANIYGISLDHLFGINAENTVTQILSDETGQKKRGSISLSKEDTVSGSVRMTYPENSLKEEIYPESSQKAADPQMQTEQNFFSSNNSNSIPYQSIPDNFSGTQYSTGLNTNYLQNYNYQNSDGSDMPGIDEELYKRLMKFPFPIFAGMLFFIAGGLFNLWHPAWMLFLLIPMYYTTVEAAYRKNLNIFCYPVFVTIVFLLSGFYMDLWHPGWLIFTTIPLYYWVVETFFAKYKYKKPKKNKKNKNRDRDRDRDRDNYCC